MWQKEISRRIESMGKITDAAIAVFVIIIGFFVLFRLGITLPMLEHVIKNFFSPSSPASNSTNSTSAGVITGMAASNSQIRAKMKRRIDEIRRRIISRSLRRAEIEAKEGIQDGTR